jgi:arabinofuranan 3-O-arabinosyltransferase
MRNAGPPPLAITVARSFAVVAPLAYLCDLLRQTGDHLTNGLGRPFGDDFINFWSGAYLAWHGRATEIYDPAAFHAFECWVAGASLDGYRYAYPPVLLLLTMPLAVIPYVPALLVWLAAGWYGFYRALRLAMPGRGALLFALATPAAFINAIGGQNGTWTAALFGAGLGLLERQPLIAGGLLGLLIYKPQLGLLVPVALLAGRRWRAFMSAAIVAGLLLAVSAVWFGVDVWGDYIRDLAVLRRMFLEDGTGVGHRFGVWHRFVSVFVAARRLGAPVETAYLVQAIVGGLAALAVALVWFREAPVGIKNAVLVLGACLATPYLQDYDLVYGALAVAWLWQCAPDTSNRALQISAGLLLSLPLVAAPLAHLTGLALGPLFIFPLFIVTLRMTFSAKAALVAPSSLSRSA